MITQCYFDVGNKSLLIDVPLDSCEKIYSTTDLRDLLRHVASVLEMRFNYLSVQIDIDNVSKSITRYKLSQIPTKAILPLIVNIDGVYNVYSYGFEFSDELKWDLISAYNSRYDTTRTKQQLTAEISEYNNLIQEFKDDMEKRDGDCNLLLDRLTKVDAKFKNKASLLDDIAKEVKVIQLDYELISSKISQVLREVSA